MAQLGTVSESGLNEMQDSCRTELGARARERTGTHYSVPELVLRLRTVENVDVGLRFKDIYVLLLYDC